MTALPHATVPVTSFLILIVAFFTDRAQPHGARLARPASPSSAASR